MKYFSMCDKKFKVYYDAKGYALIWLNGKNQKIHVLLWEIYYGGKPKGHDIHHKDFNKANYDINNLDVAKYRTKKLCKKHYQQWRRKNS